MLISLFFSANIYQISANELEKGLRGRNSILKKPIGPGFSSETRQALLEESEQLINDAKAQVLNRLIIINLFIFIGGGFLSYYLAYRTLKPIEDANLAQKRFIDDASHELRTPLTALISENEVALMDATMTKKQYQQQLASNIEEIKKLSNLTDSLLRLAGIENKDVLSEEYSLNEALKIALNRASTLAKEKNILIKSNLKNNIHLKGDQNGTAEAIFIILDNAVKYSPKNSKISISVMQNKNNVHLAIKDHGIGIKSSEQPHIFDRFYRADTSRTKQNVSGYGLGLSIAQDIVSKQGGQIDLISQPGKGSTFTIKLPK